MLFPVQRRVERDPKVFAACGRVYDCLVYLYVAVDIFYLTPPCVVDERELAWLEDGCIPLCPNGRSLHGLSRSLQVGIVVQVYYR